jgi:signal transduction histidine kinase
MKIKQKLFAWVGVLFAMIVLLMVLSMVFINRLTADTRNILVANYNTLDYSRRMQIALNEGIEGTSQQKLFEENLLLQQKNVTEVGEQELTDKLTEDWNRLRKDFSDTAALKMIRSDISDIMLLNMQAIERKSRVAGETSEQAFFWVSVIGVICFLAAFVLLVNLPGNIANPIREFSESIKEIAAKNYSRRIHYDQKNEFGELAAAFNTMAEKLEEYQYSNLQQLMMEKKRIETLINNLHDPVIGLDERHRVLFMNDTALKIAGLRADEVIGVPVQEIALKNDLVRALVQELFVDSPEAGIRKPPVKIYADNKESYFEKEIIPIRITPTGEREEKLIGNVVLLQNITPYKELDFAKTNFIATVSHELKTPIASIQMGLQLLEKQQMGPLNTEQISLLSGIREDADRLLRITGELLNMTQVESGVLQLNVAPVLPEEIVRYAVDANRSTADRKGISLHLRLQDDLPPVMADKDKTAWVLTNLISNAIRYSYDNASVDIFIELQGGKVSFSVTDTGQGIAPQYVNRVFDRYFRIPGSKKEGTGLGLSISKDLIEAQGGTLVVDSEFGAGSTFSFSLPVAKEEVERKDNPGS